MCFRKVTSARPTILHEAIALRSTNDLFIHCAPLFHAFKPMTFKVYYPQSIQIQMAAVPTCLQGQT